MLNKIILCSLLLPTMVSLNTAMAQACYPKKHAAITKILNKNYHQARKMLLANNWQPYQTVHYNRAAEMFTYGNGEIFYQKSNYFELEFCAGTGMAPCIFNLKDIYGNVLEVTTEGEEYPREKIYATVSSYQFSCDK